VGRENELDGETVEGRLDVVGRDSLFLKIGDPAGERLDEWLRITFPFTIPQHTNTLAVLGDVDEIEKDAERPGDHPGLPFIEACNPFVERGLRRMVTPAPGAGERADLLDEVERPWTLELLDHPAEHVSEESDIAAEQFGIDHVSRSSGKVGWGRRPTA
jgi:hypothetical protein